MKKKILMLLLTVTMITTFLAGCGATTSDEEAEVSQMQNEVVNENAETEAVDENAEVEAAAREAEANEYYELGRAYLYGLNGTEINLATAYDNFEKAVELGKADANFYLGLLYMEYSYPKQNDEMAKSYYKKCEGNPYANINLGFFYADENDAEADVTKAEEIYQTVIEQGCVEGYIGKAFMEEDYDTKLEYFNKVVEEGTEPFYIALAMNEIGYMYQEGMGVEQDYAKALEWLEKAADLGNSSAMNNIGYSYYYGNGIEQDYAKALEWLEKAADLGNSSAMDWIGSIYREGLGVEQDYTKALEWYEKAADLGNSNAMTWIGLIYRDGLGVEQDYAKALEWYEKAADLGNTSGMNQIGYLYYHGRGVEQSNEKALEWFEKAAALGNEKAAENAKALREQMQ